LYGKTKEKGYVTAGPDFGTDLHGKSLIIDKSLYGLKTFAAKFHEYLAESLLRLGFKKSEHDPDVWMINKATHYEYLATYVDDILIWSKDPMAVIKSLEKIYMWKGVGIPHYYLGGNVEVLGEAWKNHGLGLNLSARAYIQNVIPNFESLCGKEFKPVKTPMSEGYFAFHHCKLRFGWLFNHITMVSNNTLKVECPADLTYNAFWINW
jgi:Reverse transcriptase (RNA-dependent DNA polymerase)